jgi:hypothetical protein
MMVIRKYAVFGASLLIALGIGHAMQSTTAPDHPALVLRALETDDPATRLAAARTARESDLLNSVNQRALTPLSAEVDPQGNPVPKAVAPMQLPEIALPGSFLADDTMLENTDTRRQAMRDTSAILDATVLTNLNTSSENICSRDIALTAEPAALLKLTVDAPCDPEARVVIRHAGLAVTERVSATGLLDVVLPAFSDIAEVSVAFIDGETLNARTMVQDMALYDRVAVQWQSPDAFQLHAFEFGATFDSAGHVWAATPRDAGHALRATGGFLMLLGDSRVNWPLLAEVYTFPSARVPRPGTVAIEIEAMVTPEVCGREMLGETLEIHAGGPVVVRELTVSMPGCDAEGQFIVLKNALEDLTIAAN